MRSRKGAVKWGFDAEYNRKVRNERETKGKGAVYNGQVQALKEESRSSEMEGERRRYEN